MKKLTKVPRALKIIGIILIALFLIYQGIYLYARLTPDLAIDSANGFYFYDSQNNLYRDSSKEWVSLENISENVIAATVAVEDKHFYQHQGFDFLRIVKAFYNNIVSGETVEGASTISQQYVKNLYLDFGKTWGRKLEEAWLTIRLETHYTKEEIIEGYLNTIDYGGIYGIANASRYYFGKSAADLSLAEASILAGIPKWPAKYSPIYNEEAAKERQLTILTVMVKNGYITEEEKEEAYNMKLTYVGKMQENDLKTLMYYQDAVMNELKSIPTIPDSFLITGGLKIYTNLDLNMQSTLEKNVDTSLENTPELQIASIMIEPKTGKVIALTGGRDYTKSQYNRAISAKRQVGSTIKPFLYYAALENGFTASTTFLSEKTIFTFSENQTYSPTNFNDTYGNKEISMAAAITYSDNIYAVKTHLFLGEDVLVDTAQRAGIEEDLQTMPSLALGSQVINLMDMMRGYTTLANEGIKIEPYLITKVEDINGNVLYEHQTKEENVLNKSITYVLNEMLSNCASPEFIDYSYPTCSSIGPLFTKKYAIKTGTTDSDNLTFGYNGDILMGVWTGYDDNRKLTGNETVLNKKVWVSTVEAYLKDKENTWYVQPANVVGVLVDPISGELADNNTKKKKILYYIKGTEPYVEFPDLDNLVPTIREQ